MSQARSPEKKKSFFFIFFLLFFFLFLFCLFFFLVFLQRKRTAKSFHRKIMREINGRSRFKVCREPLSIPAGWENRFFELFLWPGNFVALGRNPTAGCTLVLLPRMRVGELFPDPRSPMNPRPIAWEKICQSWVEEFRRKLSEWIPKMSIRREDNLKKKICNFKMAYFVTKKKFLSFAKIFYSYLW